MLLRHGDFGKWPTQFFAQSLFHLAHQHIS
jgi:hypothetical protein